MDLAFIAVEKIAEMFLIILVGVMAFRWKIIDSNANKKLSGILLKIVTPAMIFMAYQIDYQPERLKGLIITFFISLASFVWVILLAKALIRAEELELMTIVCANTPEEAASVAKLGPDIMICEPTSLIGTGKTSGDEYILATNRAVKAVNPDIKVIQAAGVSTGEDVYRVVMEGADGSGGTSGILNAPSRREKIVDMLEALKRAQRDRTK